MSDLWILITLLVISGCIILGVMLLRCKSLPVRIDGICLLVFGLFFSYGLIHSIFG